jgi:uncharacterized HhH-GPD family protein
MASPTLHITGETEADQLLSNNPLALLLGMVLDQQVPLEWAFRGPLELSRRIGGDLKASSIASMDPDQLKTLFSEKPALHRYPGSMAARCQEVCKTVADEYQDDASIIWTGAQDAQDLYQRIKAIPGFGEMKSKIFIALLGKQLKITTPDWQSVCAPYGEAGSFRSVADIVDPASLDKVRETKAAAKRKAASAKS